MKPWHDQDLLKATPSLGFSLDTALLIPSFVRRALDSGYVTDTANTQVTPLDDIKNWMRDDPWRSGELFEQLSELLLGEEKKARKAAEKAGVQFDVVGYELEQMQSDDSYEVLTPEWACRCLELAVDEADAIQAWSRRTNNVDLSLAVSFQLPDPSRHQRLSREQIAAALAEYGADGKAVESVLKNRRSGLEFSGAFHLDLRGKEGAPPAFSRRNGVAFVNLPLADARAGDETLAQLSLAYPIEAEGYFLLSFDALRESLSLKGADA